MIRRRRRSKRTSNAGKQLTSKALDLTVGEGHETVSLEEVKDTLTQKIHDDTDVASVIKAIPQVDASIPILIIVGF
jgi:hypothetical protein